MWIESHTFFEQPNDLRPRIRIDRSKQRQCPQIKVVSIKIIGPLASGTLDFGTANCRRDETGNRLGDAVLEVEHLRNRAAETLCPEFQTACAVQQMNADAKALAGLLGHAAQKVAHAKSGRDRLDASILLLPSQSSPWRRDGKLPEARKRRDDPIDNAVGKVARRFIGQPIGLPDTQDRA